MARSKKHRETHRSAVVGAGIERRPQLTIRLDSITIEGGDGIDLRRAKRWFATVDSIDGPLGPNQGPEASIVIDPFMFVLHLGDSGAEATGTHDGDEFLALAVERGVDVYVVVDLDARRASADEIDEASRSGKVLGARVPAFEVQAL